MKRFRYALDPICLGCCALYALNRWGFKPYTQLPLFRFWFNDLLLIPCALPPLLQMHRWLGLRRDDTPPTLGEITGHLVFWSMLFEVIGPHLMHGVTGDVCDMLAYTVGAVAAFFGWHHRHLRAAIRP